MIDLHCHVLPALDDGAVDLGDAVAMARQAEQDGIAVICATPHIRHDHHVLVEEIPERVGELNAELRRHGVSVEIVPGGEVAQTAVAGLSVAELRAVSLGGGDRWILLEPAPGPLGPELLDTVRRLEALGFHTVVAHPERHPGEGLRGRMAELVGEGALIQVTAATFAEGPAAAFLLELAQSGLVHFLASDAHSSRYGRPVRLSPGLARLQAVELVHPHRDWVAREGPAAILRGDDVAAPFSPRAV